MTNEIEDPCAKPLPSSVVISDCALRESSQSSAGTCPARIASLVACKALPPHPCVGQVSRICPVEAFLVMLSFLDRMKVRKERTKYLRQPSSQPPNWRLAWRDFSEIWGPRLLKSCLDMAISHTESFQSKQTSPKFASEPPKLLRSPSRVAPCGSLS